MVARKSWVAALAVAACGGALWWWLAGDDAAPDAPPTPHVDAPGPAGASVAAPVADDPIESTTVAPLAAQRDAVAAPPPPGGPSVQVRVLAADGRPVPGLEVRYLDSGQTAAAMAKLGEAERRRLARDRDAQLLRLSSFAVTDAEGVARWPWRERDHWFWSCVAWHGDQYGDVQIPMAAPATDVHELRLVIDVRFTVEVLDAGLRPAADVPVTAAYLRGEAARPLRQLLGHSDEAGRLLVPHVQTWRDRIRPRGAVRPAVIGADLPGVDGGREIDAHALPGEPVRLLLPPTGAFVVTVFDPFGERAAQARLQLIEDVASAERVAAAEADERGVARFPWVGLGRQWRLGREGEPRERWLACAGPRAAGEVVDVELRPAPQPIVRGRLLRSGEPFAGGLLMVTAGDWAFAQGEVRVAVDGGFKIAVQPGWRDRTLTELQVRPVSDRWQADGLLATWRGTLVLAAGVHDLGTLTLQPEPVIAAGRVVAPGGGGPPPEVVIGVEVATGEAGEPWRRLRLRVRREPDGAFALFGEPPAGSLRLQVATNNRFLPVAPLPFAAGARDLFVELRAGGSLQASIVAGSPLAAFGLQPLLVPVERAVEPTAWERFHPELDSRMACTSQFLRGDPLEVLFTWPALLPGRYRFEVRTRGVQRPQLVIPDVVVRDGERNDEPRLQRLVVPGLRGVELLLPQAGRLLAETGGRSAGVVFTLDGDQLAESCWQVDGPKVLFATAQPLDVWIRLHGCRDRIVRGIVGDQTIELAPGLPVVLRADGGGPAPGERLGIELTSRDDPLTAANGSLYSAAAGGALAGYRLPPIAGEWTAATVELRVPAPGRYAVTARRVGAGDAAALAVTPAELQVGPDGGAFVVRLGR